MRIRRLRHARPIERVRSEWADELRAAAIRPGIVRIAVRDDETEAWAAIEVGTGQANDVVRLLQEAFAEAEVESQTARHGERS